MRIGLNRIFIFEYEKSGKLWIFSMWKVNFWIFEKNKVGKWEKNNEKCNLKVGYIKYKCLVEGKSNGSRTKTFNWGDWDDLF